MSRNGSGVYSLPAGNPVVTGTTISSSWANTTLSDISTALTGSVASDGQTAMTGNLQMGNNKVTGLAVATSSGDALSFGQAATISALTVTGAFAANGGATLGDASGDALTINSSAVSIPNGLNFDSNTLVIDATNNFVGVGRASPSSALDVNGVATFSAGSVSAPAITTTGDTNTGIFFPAADTIAFSEGGTEVARFDSAGNLGVGTTTPTVYGSYKTLEVRGSGGGLLQIGTGATTAAFLFQDGTNSGFQNIANGAMTFATNNTERMRIDSSGNLLVGTTGLIGNSQVSVKALSGKGGLSVEQAQAGDYCFKSYAFNNGGAFYYHYFVAGSTFTGQITSNGTTTSYATTSDYRLKDNVVPMTNALSVVQQLKPVTYNWKLNNSNGQGFLAHELQEVVPECVTGEKDAVDADGNPQYQSIDTSFLVATLTAAIQELKAEVDSLKAQLETK